MPIRSYEALYIMRPDVAEESLDSAITKFEKTVGEQGGELLKTNEWGLRPLAHEIKHYDKGYYVMLEFKGTPEQVRKLEERFKLDENVLRYQVVCTTE